MSPLVYIILKSVKNSLLELLKKPGKLIMYLLIAAGIIGIVVTSLLTTSPTDADAPIGWFTGVLFLFISLFVGLAFAKGLSGGDAIFGMNDVNLLFVSPVSPRKILLYGIMRMAKAAFASGFFILFQTGTLARFGIGYGGVLLTFAGFLVSMMVLMVASLLIYSVANGNPGRKRAVKFLAALLLMPLAGFIAYQYLHTKDIMIALEAAIASPFMRYIPVAGWTASGVTAFLSGEAAAGFIFFGLNLLLFAGMVAYILLTNPDYYEDVLVATETAYEKKRAMAEGKLDTSAPDGKPAKIAKTGIFGTGAAALFGKHIRESYRQNRLGFLTLPSVLIVTGAVILSIFIRELSVILQILMWTQIFLIGTGRGLRETYSHYIYLIPESSFKKIIWSNMEVMARTLMESIMIFGISGLLLWSHLAYILVCIMVYTLFSFLLVGINYLSMRFTGADLSNGLMILIYYIAVVLAMLPGVVLAVVVGSIIGGDSGYFVGLLVLSGWELAAGLCCFALAKGVLHSCDMAMMKTGG